MKLFTLPEMTKEEDMFIQMFFSRLVNNENSMIFSAYESDKRRFLRICI